MTDIATPHKPMRQYDVAVYIGRFQPFHKGHWGVVRQALEIADRVLILVGSANLARDTRNPFSYDERKATIRAAIHDAAVEFVDGTTVAGPAAVADLESIWNERIIISPLNDSPHDKTMWLNQVSFSARQATQAVRPRIALIGNVRDSTSEYLDWFPAWDYVASHDTGINATGLRYSYFRGNVDFHKKGWDDNGVTWSNEVFPSTIQFLDTFRGTTVYPFLMKQRDAETAYRKEWGPGPFLTVDPVVIKGDHVLMIERGGLEGTGSIGLPGGFHTAGERMLYAACREAIEETALFISDIDYPAFTTWLTVCKIAEREKRPMPEPPPCVKAAIALLMSYQRGKGERFDDPHRSRRGHLITEAFLFALPAGHGLPPVRAGSDARRAFWMPVSEVTPWGTFEDHAFIIDKMLNQL